MKYYLSSYKLGNKGELLSGKKLAYIPNALDFPDVDLKRKEESIAKDIAELESAGVTVSVLDLQDYFSTDSLKDELLSFDGVFIRGGNVFILRQAMKLSGLDELLLKLKDTDFLYAGYSAAGCVLSESLDGYKIVDDSTLLPYPQITETIWQGLGLIDFVFLPHFDSNHSESDDISKELAYCKSKDLPYKTLRDGEVFLDGF